LRRSRLNMARSSREATTDDSLICLTFDSLTCVVQTEQLWLSNLQQGAPGEPAH
jgi:hypothetical protein